jgi:N-acetylmuramoyl-L-alanine amidase
MAKKIYLSPSSQPANTYAVGDTNEQEQCRKIAAVARDALVRCGFDVMAGMDGTMYTRIRESNNWGADAHIPIHTNAFDGKLAGFRGFYYKANGEGHKLIKAIMDTVSPLTPGTADGVSAYPGLYEVSNSSGYCAYVELGFHDNAEEAQYIIDHTQELGEAICQGVCNHYGVEYVAPVPIEKPVEEPVAEEKPAAKKKIYRVQVGAFTTKKLATELQKKLKEEGYDTMIVEGE